MGIMGIIGLIGLIGLMGLMGWSGNEESQSNDWLYSCGGRISAFFRFSAVFQ